MGILLGLIIAFVCGYHIGCIHQKLECEAKEHSYETDKKC
jgi:hypothetical protein